jgi:N-acetylmuramoyl-L-alanine amidase
MRVWFAAGLVVLALAVWVVRVPLMDMFAFASGSANAAATFFVESISSEWLRLVYANGTTSKPVTPIITPIPIQQKVKILIVPGHEPMSGGTQYNDYTERDIVVDIANQLAQMLATNEHYEVIVARSKTAWNPILSQYFIDHATDIKAFRDTQMALMDQYLKSGQILPLSDQIQHMGAATEAGFHLYAINKWASDNNVGVTIHLHLNDYAGRRAGQVEYAGFAVYVPDHQYSNAKASLEIGEAIANRLNAYHATSSMPLEAEGVIEDQQLIAVGSANTASAASVLIEYGYIYERQFSDPLTRSVAVQDYAYDTYLGVQDFFKDPMLSRFGTRVLPYKWLSDSAQGALSPDVFALQAALHYVHMYPPTDRPASDCPVSGFFGPCTLVGLQNFQRSVGLPVSTTFDAATKAALTAAYLGTSPI